MEFKACLELSVGRFWQIRLNICFSDRHPEFHPRLAWYIRCSQSMSQQWKGPYLGLFG